MKRLRIALLGTLLAAGTVFGHSGDGEPLFVAADGEDRGGCIDQASPCQSIGYALSRVGKGGEIRVAAGRYEVSGVEDVFHLVSGVVAVSGGYDRSFERQSTMPTTLVGIPAEYRSLLGSRGFQILADRKSLPVAATTEAFFDQQKTMQAGLSMAPCVGGQVGGLACSNTELLSHVPFAQVSATPGASADVWGFVDLNTNREYALVGYNIGTAVFDVTTAENPREVGFVDGQSSTWRDIKVHQYFNALEGRWNAYAYVTTDLSTDGLFVIDLTDLPQRISRVTYASDFFAAHNVFAANTDYGTGLSLTGDAPNLVIAGANRGGGSPRLYSLQNPASPSFVAQPGAGDYTHDAAYMIIRDSRKDTQCVNAVDYCEVLFDFNESTIDIWDITDPANAVRLSRTPYSNSAYTHSGWPSEDGMYLFVHDELDEQQFGLQTTLRTFSLADLRSPTAESVWRGPTRAIDHNGFVRGNRYYMSNYSRGLTILDITDPTLVAPIGRLDTYPFSDSAGFVGAWGAYPYFHSGNVAVSDMSSGFYMVADDSRGTVQGSLDFTDLSYGGDEGTTISLSVARSGGTTGAVSVDYELIPATAGSTDVASVTGSLNWADGQSGNQTINVTPLADGAAENLELMLLRLNAPTGGATLGNRSVVSVYVSDPGAGSVVEFATDTVNVTERGFGTAVATVQRGGSAVGAVSVDFSLSGGDATAGSDYSGTTAGTLAWADGDATPRTLEFPISDDGLSEGNEFFELSLSSPGGATLGANTTMRITILDGTGSNSAPNAVAGSSQTVGSGSTVTLDGGSSNDPDGDTLSYQWSQVSGTSVALSGATSRVATFTAPSVTSDTLLTFRLDVSDTTGLSDSATVNVTVRAPGVTGGSSGGSGSIGVWFLMLLALAGLMPSRVSRKDAA